MEFVQGEKRLACLVCNSKKVQEKCNSESVVGDGDLNTEITWLKFKCNTGNKQIM